MKIIIQFFLIFLYSISTTLLARELTCPPLSVMKQIKFIQAKSVSFDPTCWNFISNSFVHDNITWNVVFGTFFPGAKTPDQALIQGQRYYDKAKFVIENPEPDIIQKKTVICDYMSTGEEFWAAAISPPEKTPPSLVKNFNHANSH